MKIIIRIRPNLLFLLIAASTGVLIASAVSRALGFFDIPPLLSVATQVLVYLSLGTYIADREMEHEERKRR